MMTKARCGHVEERFYSDAHHGLCRKCHSNFAFLQEFEQKYGEDALIEYGMLKYSPIHHRKVKGEDVGCFIDHLIEYCQLNLIKFPSKQKYIKKMLYMLHSLQEPFDIETLR